MDAANDEILHSSLTTGLQYKYVISSMGAIVRGSPYKSSNIHPSGQFLLRGDVFDVKSIQVVFYVSSGRSALFFILIYQGDL